MKGLRKGAKGKESVRSSVVEDDGQRLERASGGVCVVCRRPTIRAVSTRFVSIPRSSPRLHCDPTECRRFDEVAVHLLHDRLF